MTSASDFQLKQDLLWSITSPPLVDNPIDISSVMSIEDVTRWILHDADLNNLRQLINNNTAHRLGTYFENLWHFVLAECPLFTLFGHGIAVRNATRTLGEFDFVYKNNLDKSDVHLEIAVKFYLQADIDDSTGNEMQWIGPGGKDRLDLKLEYMLSHQIPLSKTPEGQQALTNLGVSSAIRKMCLRGYLFYPLNAPKRAPVEAHNHHLFGYWLRLSQLTELPEEPHWLILGKMSWLSRAFCQFPEKLLTRTMLIESLPDLIDAKNFPIMVATLSFENDRYREQARFFVVPDEWPRL